MGIVVGMQNEGAVPRHRPAEMQADIAFGIFWVHSKPRHEFGDWSLTETLVDDDADCALRIVLDHVEHGLAEARIAHLR